MNDPTANTGLPALQDSANVRRNVAGLLYLAQGLPQGVLFVAIPSWMAANGQESGAVAAVVAAATLPWTLKFGLGALVDRHALLSLGQRRGWVIAAQALIITTLLCFAAIAPTPDAFALIVLFTLALSIFTALQDTALDAMMIDVTPGGELGRINAAMFAGKIIGMAGGAAVAGAVLYHFGFATAMLAMAGFFSLPALVAAFVRERPGEAQMQATRKAPRQEILRRNEGRNMPAILRAGLAALASRDMQLIILFSLFTGTKSGIMNVAGPLFAVQKLRWNEADYGLLMAGIALAGVILILWLGGRVTDRFGPRVIACTATVIGTAALIILILIEDMWQHELVFISLFSIFTLFAGLAYLCLLVLGMRICNPRIAATTFAIITAAEPIGGMIGAGLVSGAEAVGGMQLMLGCGACAFALAGAAVLGISANISGPQSDSV